MARFTCYNPFNVYDVIPCDTVASVILLAGAALHQVRSIGEKKQHWAPLLRCLTALGRSATMCEETTCMKRMRETQSQCWRDVTAKFPFVEVTLPKTLHRCLELGIEELPHAGVHSP
jgi:hypothetical protein